MSVRQQGNTGYGLSQALIDVPLLPIVSLRAPASDDKAAIGTIWIYKPNNLAYVLTSVVNNVASWINISQSPGDFVEYSVQTVDDTPTAIATFALAASSAINIYANIAAAKSDFSAGGGGFIQGAFRRAGAGPVRIGALNPNFQEDGAPGDLDITMVEVGNTVQLQVVGLAAQVFDWTAQVSIIELP